MSLLGCMSRLFEVKQLSQKTRDEILEYFQYDRQIDLESASFAKQLEGLKGIAKKKAIARVQAIKQTLATARVETAARSHAKGINEGWRSELEKTWTRVVSLRSQAGARMGRWLDEIGPQFIGFGDNIAAQEDALRIARGAAPLGNDPASLGFAKAAIDTGEWFRQQMIEAGSPIALRVDYGTPQLDNYRAIREVPLDEYMAFVRDRLDYSRIYKPSGERMSRAEVDLVIKAKYEAAVTNGASRLTPGSLGQRTLANQWLDSRVLAFKPEGFIEYNRRFGEGDAIKLYMKHFDALAHDLGMMQQLGPDPRFTHDYMADVIKIETGKDVGEGAGRAKWMWQVLDGETNQGLDSITARVGQGFRNILSMGLLPSAPISSFTGDLMTATHAAKLRGMSAMRMLGHYMTLLGQGKENRAFAARTLAAADMFLSELHAGRRLGDISADGLIGKATDKLFRLSGMTGMTSALKAAFNIEFLSMLGENAGKGFDALPIPIKAMFAEYGFKAAHWDVLRRAPMIQGTAGFSGVKALDVANIPMMADIELQALGLKRDAINDVFRRITDMITTESETYAVPTPNLRTKALTTLGTRADDPLGQGWRTLMLFKSFPLVYMLGHVMRGLTRDGIANRAAYLGTIGAMLTIAGAIRNQMVDVVKGNDPENMGTAKFWGKAFLAGGGATLFGDFIGQGLQGKNRYEKDALITLLGPGAQWANDTASLLLGTPLSVVRGDDVNFESRASRAVQMMRMYTPKLWYTRLAFDRLIWDQLQYLADPNSAGAWARIARRQIVDREVDSWWRAGEFGPERAPDLGAAVR